MSAAFYSVGFDGAAFNAGSGAYTLTTTAGAFTYTGYDVTLRGARQLPVSASAFVLVGGATFLTASRRIAAASGNYTLSGLDASLRALRRLAPESGFFGTAGNQAAMNHNAKIAYARAPRGFGYSSQRAYAQIRTVTANTTRPPAIQRNER